MIQEADKSGTGEIQFEDFYRVVTAEEDERVLSMAPVTASASTIQTASQIADAEESCCSSNGEAAEFVNSTNTKTQRHTVDDTTSAEMTHADEMSAC